MVLELCAYGSLSDVLRGSQSGRIPFHLSERDQIFLALGCARYVSWVAVGSHSCVTPEGLPHFTLSLRKLFTGTSSPSTSSVPPPLSLSLSLCLFPPLTLSSPVDSQFNAKLADLELGVPTFGSDKEQPFSGPTVDDFLVNWVAPEVLRGEPFSQASDVYSLSLVFHEILTRLIPYEDLPTIRETARSTIKDLVQYPFPPSPLLSSMEA
jgi:hypothetical protein